MTAKNTRQSVDKYKARFMRMDPTTLMIFFSRVLLKEIRGQSREQRSKNFETFRLNSSVSDYKMP
jgi:hypothetical protein